MLERAPSTVIVAAPIAYSALLKYPALRSGPPPVACTPSIGSQAGAATDVPFPDRTTDGSPDGVQLFDRTAVICRSPARAGSLSDWPGPAGSLSCAHGRVVRDHAL